MAGGSSDSPTVGWRKNNHGHPATGPGKKETTPQNRGDLRHFGRHLSDHRLAVAAKAGGPACRARFPLAGCREARRIAPPGPRQRHLGSPETRWIPTINQGRVERILVLPGARVKADTVLVELSNPDVTQAAADSESAVRTEEANMANLRVTLDSSRLTQRAAVATAQAAYSNARLDFEVNEELSKSGLVPAITLKQLKTHAEELGSLLDIEQERLKISAEATTAQIAAQEAKLDQVRGQVDSSGGKLRGSRFAWVSMAS